MTQNPILVAEGYCRFPSWHVQSSPNVIVQIADNSLRVTDGDLVIDVWRMQDEREEHHYESMTHYWYAIGIAWQGARKARLSFETQFQLYALPGRNWVLKTRYTTTAEKRMGDGYGTKLKTLTMNAHSGQCRRFDEECHCKAERLVLQGCRQCLTLKAGELLVV